MKNLSLIVPFIVHKTSSLRIFTQCMSGCLDQPRFSNDFCARVRASCNKRVQDEADIHRKQMEQVTIPSFLSLPCFP